MVVFVSRDDAKARWASATAGSFVLVAFLTGCGGTPSAPSSDNGSGRAAPAPTLLTTTSPSLSGLEALATGRLIVDSAGCVQLKTASGALVTPAWPDGYRTKSDGTHFVVLDSTGARIASDGVDLRVGGGGLAQVPATWSNARCASTSGAWQVGRVDVK